MRLVLHDDADNETILLTNRGLWISTALLTAVFVITMVPWSTTTTFAAGTIQSVTETHSSLWAMIRHQPPIYQVQHLHNGTILSGPLLSQYKHGLWTLQKHGADPVSFLVHFDHASEPLPGDVLAPQVTRDSHRRKLLVMPLAESQAQSLRSANASTQ